jgi:NADH:ubiquinone oxidoreductase subunit 3 (subunit A)
MPADCMEQPSSKQKIRARFTFTSVLVLMVVFATVAASLAHLWRAANGSQADIGFFVVVTAMSPLLVLVFTAFAFRILRWLGR